MRHSLIESRRHASAVSVTAAKRRFHVLPSLLPKGLVPKTVLEVMGYAGSGKTALGISLLLEAIKCAAGSTSQQKNRRKNPETVVLFLESGTSKQQCFEIIKSHMALTGWNTAAAEDWLKMVGYFFQDKGYVLKIVETQRIQSLESYIDYLGSKESLRPAFLLTESPDLNSYSVTERQGQLERLGAPATNVRFLRKIRGLASELVIVTTHIKRPFFKGGSHFSDNPSQTLEMFADTVLYTEKSQEHNSIDVTVSKSRNGNAGNTATIKLPYIT